MATEHKLDSVTITASGGTATFTLDLRADQGGA